jgi:hypothetical protein
MRPGEFKICQLCERHGCDDCHLSNIRADKPHTFDLLKTKGWGGQTWGLLWPEGVPHPLRIVYADWEKKRAALRN